MTIVSQTPAQQPSALAMVNRVLSECGVEQLSTLSGTTFRPAITALNALNDCVNDIYCRNRWEWLSVLAYINLIDGASQYPLPADFGRLSEPCRWNGNTLSEKTLDEWFSQVVPAPTSSGQPFRFCVHNKILYIDPAPNSTIVGISPQLSYLYYRDTPASLTTASDSATFNVPNDFTEALVAFAKYKVKLLLEYPDAQIDAIRYERCIQVQLNKTSQARKKPRMRQGSTVNYTSWW